MTTYKWFTPRPATLSEGQEMYRRLAAKHHPDVGGRTEDMQEINAEWEDLRPRLPKFCSKQAREGREQYQQAHAAEQAARAAQNEEAAKMAAELAKMPGLQFDVVGSWIWADCNHKYSKRLQDIGFRWSANRCKYYWHAAGDESRRNRKASYQDLYNKYDGQSYRTKSRETIPA